MARITLQVLLAAFAVTLAGCSGGIMATNAQAGTGTVDLYISDEPNAMDDFEHLNVTVSNVGFHQAGENGTWDEREVENETVIDLTELRGANATLLEQYELENGTYDTVFVYVDEIDATLTTGESVNVKLPSEKLHVNRNVTVGKGSETDFVFDISVHKAGNSGKYILKPVVSESGTDVPIERVGEDDDGEDRDVGEGRDDGEEDERGDDRDDSNESDQAALDIAVDGTVTAGENVTLTVTQNSSAVANATVMVDGETVGSTAADGMITVQVPDNDEFDIEVEKGDMEGEREL